MFECYSRNCHVINLLCLCLRFPVWKFFLFYLFLYYLLFFICSPGKMRTHEICYAHFFAFNFSNTIRVIWPDSSIWFSRCIVIWYRSFPLIRPPLLSNFLCESAWKTVIFDHRCQSCSKLNRFNISAHSQCHIRVKFIHAFYGVKNEN